MAKRRKRNRAVQPEFAVGDKVVVKRGVTDPDYPDMPLGGWTGTVEKIWCRTPVVYDIRWDHRTLDGMHPVFLKRCERDGLDAKVMGLSAGDLLPDTGELVPLEQPMQIITRPLSPEDQDDRVREALELTSDDPLPGVDEATLLKYHQYLAGLLSLPFEAQISEDTDIAECGGGPLIILGLADPAEFGCDELVRSTKVNGCGPECWA